jgi:hypothetical protein
MGKTYKLDSTLRSMRNAFKMTKQRCLNPKCSDYSYYGGRGITIDPRWLESFDNFLTDMGVRPPGMTLERLDNDKGYTKANCVWAPRAAQSNNTRAVKKLTWKGRTDSISGWERHLGWKPGVLKARLRLGYTLQQAMTKPVHSGVSLPERPRKTRTPNTYRVKVKGLKHPNTKLNAATVRAMRNLAHKGTSFSKLATLYGVTTTTASNAVQAKGAYKYV